MNDDHLSRQIIEAFKQRQAQKLARRMSRLGKIRSAKKIVAARKNVKRAHAVLRKKERDPKWLKKRYGAKR